MIEFEAGSGHHSAYGKKILIAIILIAMIIIIAYFTNGKYIYKKENVYNYNAEDLSYIVTNANKDSNGDGIENWRANLLGADPLQNADNTHYNDVSNEKPKSLSQSTTSNKERNLTEDAAINIYAAASEMRASGNTSTPAATAIGSAIATQAIDATKNKTINIDESKIVISNDNSRDALKVYGNKLMTAVIRLYPKVNEASVLDKYYKTNNINVLKDLQSNVDMLSLMMSEIYKINVPSSAYTIHIEVLSRISGAINVEKSLMRTDKDALAAMIALQELKSFDKIVPATLADLKAFFDKKNVYFISSEPGFIINK